MDAFKALVDRTQPQLTPDTPLAEASSRADCPWLRIFAKYPIAMAKLETTTTERAVSGTSYTDNDEMNLRVRRAALEVRAEHLVKAGRDLFVLGFVVAVCGFFVAPESNLPMLAIPSGCVLYVIALYAAMHLRRHAMRHL